MPKTIPEAKIREVFQEVLEQMAFLFAEPVDSAGLPAPQGPCAQAAIHFQGPLCGEISLVVPEGFCAAIAANLLGLDEDDPQALEKGLDALKEVVNVTGNHLLTELNPEGAPLEVTAPSLTRLDSAGWKRLRTEPGVHCFQIDDHPALLRLGLREDRH